jgi:hypothetical protein
MTATRYMIAMMEAGLLTLGESTIPKELAMRCTYHVEELSRQNIGTRDRIIAH